MTVRETMKSSYRKRGWFKVAVVDFEDSVAETLPSVGYAIAQFRHRGDAWHYSQQLAGRMADSHRDAILIF
jgi:hypothetical protein